MLVAAAVVCLRGVGNEIEAQARRSPPQVCVLAVSPANALTVTRDFGATTSSVPGAVLFDDFDSVVDTSIGTITGGRPVDPSHGTAPADGNFIIADGLLGSPFNVTVTLTNPVTYVGFAWGTSDPFNKLDVYDGSTLLGSFFGVSPQRTYYFNIQASPVEAITKKRRFRN
jgi:hypothetical protein